MCSPETCPKSFFRQQSQGAWFSIKPVSLLEELRLPGQQLDNSRGNSRATEKQGTMQPTLVEPPCWVKSCLGEGDTKLVKTKNLLSQCGHGGHRNTKMAK